MNATLELRVLSGLHREARCPVTHGALVGAMRQPGHNACG